MSCPSQTEASGPEGSGRSQAPTGGDKSCRPPAPSRSAPGPHWRGLSPEPEAAPAAAMLCRLQLLPPAPGPVAARLGPVRTLWPAPGALFAELERELLRELETARAFASSMGQLLAGGGSSSPGGEPGQSSSVALAQGTAQPFAVRQDVGGFAPQELAVKLVGRKVLLTGRKETQSEDGKGSFSYKYEVFKREWDVPEAVDTDRLTCSISREGQLCIEAPCLAPAAVPARNVPIQLSPAGGSAAPAEPGSEDGADGRAQG
ncbi:uncharacterized protein [Lepidochelys kempii]|uniref:uncharacterized protein n=1 Tax=Lepidochelys kempii TaxID=8472 RepID=UPI003C6FB9B4